MFLIKNIEKSKIYMFLIKNKMKMSDKNVTNQKGFRIIARETQLLTNNKKHYEIRCKRSIRD